MSLSQRIAVLGAGNLGGALIQGLLEAGTSLPDRLSIADASTSRVEELRAQHGLLLASTSNHEAAAAADVIVIAVKPHIVAEVIAELAEDLRADQLLISFAAAVPLRRIEAGLNAPSPVIRAMPNIAMTAHASATALCGNGEASEDHLALAAEIFGSVGETVFVSEDQMHAVTGLSGSGPAYVFTMIEALAAGGVKMGLPAAVARRLAAQTLFGAAKMALATGPSSRGVARHGDYPGRHDDRRPA